MVKSLSIVEDWKKFKILLFVSFCLLLVEIVSSKPNNKNISRTCAIKSFIDNKSAHAYSKVRRLTQKNGSIDALKWKWSKKQSKTICLLSFNQFGIERSDLETILKWFDWYMCWNTILQKNIFYGGNKTYVSSEWFYGNDNNTYLYSAFLWSNSNLVSNFYYTLNHFPTDSSNEWYS